MKWWQISYLVQLSNSWNYCRMTECIFVKEFSFQGGFWRKQTNLIPRLRYSSNIMLSNFFHQKFFLGWTRWPSLQTLHSQHWTGQSRTPTRKFSTSSSPTWRTARCGPWCSWPSAPPWRRRSPATSSKFCSPNSPPLRFHHLTNHSLRLTFKISPRFNY